MPKISMAEKEMMAKVIREDLALINSEITRQFREIWEETRAKLEDELGITAKKAEIEKIEEEIERLREKVGDLQREIKEYNDHPTIRDYQEAGLEPPSHRNGYIYEHDREYFGIPINTMMDIYIVKRIKETMDPDKPFIALAEIAQSAYRALVMSGTYEEARKAYETFYNLDFRRFGVKIPRRLEEIKKVEGKNLMSAKIVAALPPPEEKS